MSNPWEKQIGGEHYKKYAIQPTEYAEKNGLSFAEGCIVKYVTRWRDKGGVEDLKKIIHYAEILIDIEQSTDREAARDLLLEEARTDNAALNEYWKRPK